MKNIIGIFALSILLLSCTSQKQDQELLQKQFELVYYMGSETNRYVCIDTANNVFDVRVNCDGSIESKVKINQ